ncbi:vascular endothelial growth factor C isoform X1 [Acanthochromis polyacanthus]|uniref:vascular endothelial growth factor C isoform X1 n=1 Tax=Acanthochromis polyacanthus TaxID=80966 RepID=UPI0022345988|nr:vascular endothelial growth factor C isoform X1 [Acanthochromis polyacanthus]
MHLLEISLLLANLICTNLATDFSHSDYYEYYEQEQTYEADSPPKSDMEQKLRSASSVDELMTLIYPSYWAALKCTSKLSTAVASTASKVSQHPQPHLLRPLADPEESTFAAAYLNLDVLKSIESEWRKTQCMPKEVCVDVGREFGAPTNIFYKPPCVSVYRCGGCCHSEDKQCKNISTGYLSKTLFEITVPITQGTKPVTISVANHTQCSCLSKLDIYKQVHSIIRRSLSEHTITNHKPTMACAPTQTHKTMVWIIGDSYVRRGAERAAETMGSNLGIDGVLIHWFSWGGLRWRGVRPFFDQSLRGRAVPDVLLIHCGGNDLRNISSVKLIDAMKEDLHHLHLQHPGMSIIFSGIAQRCRWKAGANPGKIDKARKFVNSVMATYVQSLSGHFIHHPAIRFDTSGLFLHDGVHFTTRGT